jgi:chromosome segregation ATPase
MADVHEQIKALQMRVSKLETWAGPGQADALSAGMRALRTDVADIRRVQRQHTGLLGALNRDVAGLSRVQEQHTGLLGALNRDVAELSEVQEQHTGQLGKLDQDLAGLSRVQEQHTAQLGKLGQDVAVLKTDMAEVKMMLAEILRRLPPAAG